jgi:hypothetical protein
LRYLSMKPLNTAQIMARAAYRRINDSAVDFFRDLGGVENLPEGFNVSDEGWLNTEREIDKAAQEFNIEKTLRLCREYERRALAYFQAWRKKIEKQKGAIK